MRVHWFFSFNSFSSIRNYLYSICTIEKLKIDSVLSLHFSHSSKWHKCKTRHFRVFPSLNPSCYKILLMIHDAITYLYFFLVCRCSGDWKTQTAPDKDPVPLFSPSLNKSPPRAAKKIVPPIVKGGPLLGGRVYQKFRYVLSFLAPHWHICCVTSRFCGFSLSFFPIHIFCFPRRENVSLRHYYRTHSLTGLIPSADTIHRSKCGLCCSAGNGIERLEVTDTRCFVLGRLSCVDIRWSQWEMRF